MVNGLYTASRSMRILQNRMDVLSHNLANTNSTGFKESMLVSRAEVTIGLNAERLLHQDEDQYVDDQHIVFSQGPLVGTDDPFDLAIQGDGFFEVDTPDGVRYTRNGAFTRNYSGELVTLNGHNVLDSSGSPIVLDGDDFVVSRGGIISVDNQQIAQLALVNFEDKSTLVKEGSGYFQNTNPENRPTDNDDLLVQQGMLEGSNVNSVDSMVHMIRINRMYDSNQKVIHAIDETLDKAVNQVSRIN
jgi:flagellar basal-body rod protein FlgF